MMPLFSNDAKVIALLCASLERSPQYPPLTQAEYSTLANWLKGQGMTPASLLKPQVELTQLNLPAPLNTKRLTSLLSRGVLLGMTLEELTRSGIELCCRSDASYPARYKKKLADKAPALFYYSGNLDLAHRGGLAVVGSRNLDSIGEEFSRNVGKLCANHGMTVISGGARGVDSIAMLSALENGGCAIGILCENLRAKSVSKQFRKHLSDGRLLLLSPYHPDFKFAAWAAMARNKLIYALADFALVVSSDISSSSKKSGTWEGALEELKRKDAISVFVRYAEDAPIGNKALLENGAKIWPEDIGEDLYSKLARLAESNLPKSHVKKVTQQCSLFDEIGHSTRINENRLTDTEEREERPERVTEAPQNASESKSTHAEASLYELCLPHILKEMKKPISIKELAQLFDLHTSQLTEWIKKAEIEGKVRKHLRPVRYSRVEEVNI